ncbi:MAG: RNA polymerase sigma factor [Verrucomicrobiales bacterium]
MQQTEERHRLRLEETALLQAVARGQREAFAQLYDRVAQPLYSMLVEMAKDHATAQDWMQQAMVKVWKQAHQFDPSKGHAFSWILTVVRRTALDGLRKLKRDAPHKQTLDDVPEESHNDTPARFAGFNDEAKIIKRALANLPEDQRLVLEQAFFLGRTHTEIASEQGQPLGTVKARIRRGLIRLRETLGEEGWR